MIWPIDRVTQRGDDFAHPNLEARSMYNPRHLFRVARRGLTDMLPALQQAFNDRHEDDRLDRVFGPWPRLTVPAITVIGRLPGYRLQDMLGRFADLEVINGTAVLFGAAQARPDFGGKSRGF